MPEPAPSLLSFPADLNTVYPQAELLWSVLETSLTGLALYTPLLDAAGRPVDFRIDLLNPAAQRMLQQPAQPRRTFLELYPHTLETDSFAFHRDAFESGEPAQLKVNYQADGLDNYFHIAARRVGQGLLVSFTDTADAARTDVEEALRASQTQAQTARVEAEFQRNQFQGLVDQAPVALAFFEGPELRVTAANQQMCTVWGHTTEQVLRRPLLEAVPELQNQGFDDLLRQVMATEVPFVGTEVPAQLLRDGQLTTTYYDFVYKPFYDAQGRVQGVIDVAVEVTAKVLARQQLQALTEELLAANQELETVTTVAEKARAEAELQRQQLHNVLQQAPAMICIFDGPAHTFQFVNPPYQALVGDRPLVGKPIAVAMPELAGQPVFDLLDNVYRTGETFYANEMLVQLDHDNAGVKELKKRYYNFIYQARHNLTGAIDGIFVFAYDVTTLVLARHEVQHLNEELAAINEELHASNDEYLTANTALHHAQQQLQQLNQELEERVTERTQQIREQSGRLERLIQEAPAAIAMLDGPELVFELLNPEYEALFPGRNLWHKPVLEALPELMDGPGAALLRQVYETGVTFEGREVLMHFARPGDGQLEPRYFDFIYQARYDAAGAINGLVLFGFEVTAQVQSRQQATALQAELLAVAQRQVQERETLYQVFAQTPAAICIQRGPEHRYEYVNRAYQNFFPDRQLLGRPAAEVVPETVDTGLLALLDRVYQTGETYYGNEVPVQLMQLDGSLRQMYFSFTYQAYRENGQIVGISTFAYDVAEQVLARHQREAQQGELQRVFEQAPVAIFVLNGPDYCMKTVNPAMSELLGKPIAALLGKPYFDAMPELADQGYADFLDQVWRTGQPVVAQEQPAKLARHRPGETGYFTFVYQPLHDVDHRITDIMCVAVDVTDQVQARQQVQNLNEELAAINEELQASNEGLNDSNARLTRTNVDLDNFIYTASHDLKAPIANIEGLLNAVRHELPAAGQVGEVPNMLRLMQEAIERFGRTIGHLTDVSRLQKEHEQPATHVGLARVVQDVQLDLAPLIAATAAQVHVDVPAPATLLFSEKNLRSVVYNLLSNALKYRHPDRAPVVQVRYRPEGRYQVLEVQDNGLGLDLTQGQEKLFAMFQRLHTHVEGTGIGLYMVKKMVENAGGRIEVRSAPGQVSIFAIYFSR